MADNNAKHDNTNDNVPHVNFQLKQILLCASLPNRQDNSLLTTSGSATLRPFGNTSAAGANAIAIRWSSYVAIIGSASGSQRSPFHSRILSLLSVNR